MKEYETDLIDFPITTTTYKRIEKYAVGFDDTPDKTIVRLLDIIENLNDTNIKTQKPNKPELSFHHNSESEFEEELIKSKMAEVVIHYRDGSHKVNIWNASHFNERSDLRAHLWSEYLSDWEEEKIIKAELDTYNSVIEKTIGISNHILRAVNVALNVPYKQLIKHETQIVRHDSPTPHLAISFNNGVPTYANECGFEPDDSCYYLTEEDLGISL